MPADPDLPLAAAIIVAAGRGTRLGAADKILLPLAGKPLLCYSIDAAEAATTITDIVIVAGLHTKHAIEELVRQRGWIKVSHVALGGERRQDSVEAGLRLVPADVEIVAVHDAARPLVTAALFDASIESAWRNGAAIVATPVSDTLKRVDRGLISATVSRRDLWSAQTPQAAYVELLRNAFAHAREIGLDVTDEASLLEARGTPVAIVPGSPRNLKITQPEDLAVAEALLHSQRAGR